jgi:hypothetical protein
MVCSGWRFVKMFQCVFVYCVSVCVCMFDELRCVVCKCEWFSTIRMVLNLSGDCEYEWWLWRTMSVNRDCECPLFLFFFPYYIKLYSAQQYPSQNLRVIFFFIKNQTETNTYNISFLNNKEKEELLRKFAWKRSEIFHDW